MRETLIGSHLQDPSCLGHLWHLGRGGCACTHVRGSREFSPPPCPSATQPAHIVREKTGLEPWPANQRFAGSIPSPGTCLGCGPGPQYGACEKQRIDVSLAHPCFPPSHSPLLPFSLNINNFFFLKGSLCKCRSVRASLLMSTRKASSKPEFWRPWSQGCWRTLPQRVPRTGHGLHGAPRSGLHFLKMTREGTFSLPPPPRAMCSFGTNC